MVSLPGSMGVHLVSWVDRIEKVMPTDTHSLVLIFTPVALELL